ncbi:MAG: TonB-dependent receptor [Gammaproteobacteria bacterium]|nr:TonB-dependent receptor [Gammaproteobacteria bacterium]NNF60878.1 TonB-dependent receptor [Gammaproteobacteria bacterium]
MNTDLKQKLADAIKIAIAVNAGAIGVTAANTALAQSEQMAEEEVIVTGSRIPRKDLTGPSPVSVYDTSNILQSGATSVGQMLREIPAVAGGAQTTTVNNGGTGSQNISLRGLGSTRTLVLINGRRAPDSSGSNSGVVDLNTIPIAMVERVEVLKDGASAIYGSDAIAGVVNVILKKDFQGVAIAVQTGRSGESDGEKDEWSVTFGDATDKSNYIMSLTRVEESETVAGNRDWAKQAKFLLFGEWVDGGSSAPPWGQYDGLTLGPDYAGGSEAGGLKSYSSATDSYNYAPINFQRQPNERWIANISGGTQVDALSNAGIFESTRLFGEFQYIDRESAYALAEQPLAPLAFYGFSAPYSADNEYNPTGMDISDWRRRLVEDGPRTGFTEIQTVRTVTGLEGELSNGMIWEAYVNYGEVDYSNSYGPLFDLNKVALAVGPTARDGDGVVRCDTDGDGAFTDDDDQACVPLNTFGENSITQEMVDYTSFRQNESNKVTQKVYALSLTKPDVFELPGGGVGIAGGIVRREETGLYTPDALVAQLAETGAVTGTPSDTTQGSYEVDELYFEARLPIIDILEADLGFRYSDYDTFGDTNNWKAGMQLRPNDGLLIRGSASTSFRAPTISALFGGSGISFPSVSDPCASNPTQNCINDGVPAAGFTQISTQVRTLVGGNPTVEPEEADTFTVGFVWQPDFLEGSAFALDYWDIALDNPITGVGAGVILSQCAETGEFCNKIDRFGPGPNEGAPILLDNRTTNAGAIDTNGFDLLAEWRGIETGIGTLGIRWEGAVLNEYDKTQANGVVTPHAGYFRDDEDGHFAELRWTLSGILERGPLTVQADFRFIDEVTEFGSDLVGSCWDSVAMAVSVPGVNEGLTCVTPSSPEAVNNLGNFQRTIDSASYVDLYASYSFSDNLIVYGGIDNALDEDPPLSVDGFNDNTDVRTFDTIGRYFYLGLRSDFGGK